MWPVAGQSLPEPFVPGSGDKLPAELRLVLARYVGIACGLFAVALTCATVFAFYLLWLTVPNISLPTFLEDDYVANDLQGMLFGWAYTALWVAAGAGAWLGAVKGVQALRPLRWWHGLGSRLRIAAGRRIVLGHAAFRRPGLTERSTPPHTPQRSSRCSAVSRQTVSTGSGRTT